MTAIYNDYPYWRYTLSELGERQGLFSDSPIPNIKSQELRSSVTIPPALSYSLSL